MASVEQPPKRISQIERERHLSGHFLPRKSVETIAPISKEYELLNSSREIQIYRTNAKGRLQLTVTSLRANLLGCLFYAFDWLVSIVNELNE